MQAHLQGIVSQGGWGCYISGWNLLARIDLRNVPSERVFRLRDESGRIVYLNSDRNFVRSLGMAEGGWERVEVQVNEPSFVAPNRGYRLEVIAPARFNSVPDMNNPVAGWYGPTYGITLK